MNQTPPIHEEAADLPPSTEPTSMLSPMAMATAMDRSPNLDVIEEEAVLEIEVVSGGGAGNGGVENMAYDATAETDTDAPPPVIELPQTEQVRFQLNRDSAPIQFRLSF